MSFKIRQRNVGVASCWISPNVADPRLKLTGGGVLAELTSARVGRVGEDGTRGAGLEVGVTEQNVGVMFRRGWIGAEQSHGISGPAE